MRRAWVGTVACLLLAGSIAGAFTSPALADKAIEKSDNVRLVKNFDFGPGGGGADLAYDGRYVYVVERGEGGGLHIFDPRGKVPKEVGFFSCPGNSGTDVKPIRRGLVAYDRYGGKCGLTDGFYLMDTSDPKKPRLLGGTEAPLHTMRNYPGRDLVYVSPNGCCGDLEGGIEHFYDVSNPMKPKKVGEYTAYGLGCHDIWIHVSKTQKIAACAAGSETQIWDVSDPLAPVTLSRIPTPQTFFNHTPAISSDGKLLAVGDEAHAATECVGAGSGAVWFYDISDPTLPIFQGTYDLPRGTPASSFWAGEQVAPWCSAHNFEFVPGTHTLLTGWYAGGVNVLDLSNPSMPKELAYFMPSPTSSWGGYWVEGYVWSPDEVRGLDVLEIKGLKEG